MRVDSSIAEPLGEDDPHQIGPFDIIGLLGTGGMGEVYLGVGEEGYVAVKRVQPRMVSRERFEREVGLLYRVPSGVAPSVLATDSTGERPWFATEYVPGLTLDEAVRMHGPLSANVLWLLLAETAAALHAVHDAGIVHRDLKPANLMMVRDGVKLIDFGIARAANQTGLSRNGTRYGTHGFAPPELEAGDLNVATSADVYSLGAILLFAASGRVPGVVRDVEPIREVDRDLAGIIESCLAVQPDARPTAAELLQSARSFLAPGDDLPWPMDVTKRIETRREFSRTAVGKLETVPPPEYAPPEGSEAATRAAAGQWTSKLIVVGEGAVGKSSLVKALAGLPHDPREETTHGLRVSNLALAHPEQLDITMSLSVWDFGGQEIYHAIHQFFLTGRSLFVLVANGLTSIEANRLQYWLEAITARAPDAPILLVATHTANRPADMDYDGLRARYPKIAEYVNVDNATGQGIETLRGVVAARATDLPLMGVPLPATWAESAIALASAGPAPFCTASEMRQIMTGAGVDDADEQQALASVLCHRGQLVHFPENPELSDTVVLRPQWLSTQIARVLDHPGPAARTGVLTENDLAGAWADLARETRRFLLALMHRFELTYPVDQSDDSAISIVVNWLPKSPPDYKGQWDAALAAPGCRELRIRYRLAVLPPGIPGWFLARSHRFATPMRWRTGALLRHPDGHLALLRADPVNATIDLEVRGPLPALFFAILDDGLNITLDRYPGLGIARQIPCAGHDSAPCRKVFDYAKLRNRQDNGYHHTYCDEADEDVDLDTLLLGITQTMRELSDTTHPVSGTNRVHRDLEQPEYLKLTTLLQKAQRAHCPSVFTLTPKRQLIPGKTRYTLELYCEEPGSWHPLPTDASRYEITELSPWLRTIAPFVQRTLQVIKTATPVAGAILGIAAHELHGQLLRDVTLTQQLLKDNPGHLAALDDPINPNPAQASGDPRERAETDADFRVLRKLLESLDPTTTWGGLSHVLTPEGHGLYVCPEHLVAYR